MDEKSKWHESRSRYIPALWPISTYFSWPMSDYFEVSGEANIFHIFDGENFKAIWSKSYYDELGEKVLDATYTAKNPEKTREEGLEAGRIAIEYVKKFAYKCKDKDIDTYIGFLGGVREVYADIIRKNMIFWLVGAEKVEKKILDALSDLDKETTGNIFSRMSRVDDSYSYKEEKEFKELVSLAGKNGLDSDKTKEAVAVFANKYFWFPYEYIGPDIWDAPAVYKRVKKALEKGSYKKEEKDKPSVSEGRVACIDEYNLSPDIQRDFEVLRWLSLLQDDRKRINAEISYYLNGVIIKELGIKTGVSLEEARYVDEGILELYKNNPKEYKKRLVARTEFLAEEYNGKGKIIQYEGQKGRKKIVEVGVPLGQDIFDKKEIKGNIANKGIVRGAVRVFKTSQHGSIKDGDVVVTGMTTPDFVPLLRKAAAIVTDEGGITSHAAIVSRELGIPCIIGTKIATKVLKDGDMVEVDADNGVVKILERK